MPEGHVMTGRHAKRSKNGCSTCRIRKVKCDEARPLCGRCRTARMSCEWLPSPAISRHKGDSRRSSSSSHPSSSALVPRSHRMLLPRDAFGLSAGQQLANSLQLSSMDRDYLTYFPQCSVVRWAGKPWKWGFLRHLYNNFASQSSTAMRMILAVSASELENRRSTDPNLSNSCMPVNARAGIAHYGAALGEFSGILAQCRDRKRLPTQTMVDEVIIALFFMVTYEMLFCDRQSGLAAHLSGVHAFLETCGVFVGQTVELGPNFSNVSKNILLYIMYFGINFVSLAGERQREGWITGKDEVLFFELLDSLYQDTRDTHSLVFPGEYPPEALLDDIAVFQPLELIHECMKLRYLVLPRLNKAMAKENRGDISSLSRGLLRLGKRYSNLIRISAAEKPSGHLRELQTIYYSVAEYHSLEIVLHRLACANIDEKRQQKCGNHCHLFQEIVAKLISVLKKVRVIDPSTLSRVCWPLAVAAEVVEDPAEQLWIRETVKVSQQVTGSSTVFTFYDVE